jgi:hypothetical protein
VVKARRILTAKVTTGAVWLISTVGISTWWAFMSDRPALGAYLALLNMSLSLEAFNSYAKRKLVRLRQESIAHQAEQEYIQHLNEWPWE